MKSIACLSLLTCSAIGLVSNFHILKEAIQSSPQGWNKVAPAEDSSTITLQLALKQSNMEGLLAKLAQISDPDHPDFRKHLLKEQVDSFVSPSEEAINDVTKWLTFHGIDEKKVIFSDAKDYIKITLPVKTAQSLLDTTFSVFQHVHSQTKIIRALRYSLPASITKHIDFVQPTTMLANIHESDPEKLLPQRIRLGNDTEDPLLGKCFGFRMNVDCIKQYYNMNYVPSSPKSKLGVTGYLGEYANYNDLATFATNFLGGIPATFQVESVSGASNDQGRPGVEANLDIQYTVGLTYPTKNIFYSTAGSPPFIPDNDTKTNTNEPYLDWLNYIKNLGDDDIPQTITTSYGDNEQTIPRDYAIRVCNDFAQLGARGVSLLFSSGDGGVSGSQSGSCISNDGSGRKKFIPTFPAACPYVTSVGGTTSYPEKAVSFSTGGFSDYFPRPDYQKSEVATFLSQLNDTYSGLYNTTGRGFPDVSAQGSNFLVVVSGYSQPVSGTSASSPAFAGVISNLNDYLLTQGKPPLGFLNPWLYKKGFNALNDIISGNNPGCGTKGFSAIKGWDPVTGLGTPDFEKLRNVL